MSRIFIIVATILAGLLLAALIVIDRIATVAIDEFYTPAMHSISIADAQKRGVLLASLGIEHKEFQLDKTRYKVREAWIEDHLQVRYRYYLFRRESLLNEPTLVVRIDPITEEQETLGIAIYKRKMTLTYDGRHPLTGSDGERWFARIDPPFPASVAPSVVEGMLR